MEALKKKRWGVRLTILAAILCFGAVAAALVAAMGASRGMWDFRWGFTVLRYALFAGIAGIVIALIAIFFVRQVRRKLVLVNVLAIVIAGVFVGYLGNLIRIGRTVPAIHDIATNLED